MPLRSQRPFHGRRDDSSDEPAVPPTEAPPPRRRVFGYLATLFGVFLLSSALHVRSIFAHEPGNTGTALTSTLFAGSAALFVVGFRNLKDVPKSTVRPDDDA